MAVGYSYRNRLIVSIVIFVLAGVVVWYVVAGSERRAGYLLALHEDAESANLKWLSERLLTAAAAEDAHSTIAMEARLRLAEKRAERGRAMLQEAREISWRVLEDFCASPPAGDISSVGEASEGETYCEVALLCSMKYEMWTEGGFFSLGSVEEIEALNEVVDSDASDEIKALARNMIVVNELLVTKADYRHLEVENREELMEKAIHDAADSYVAIFQEFPNTYWGAHALLKAAACHAQIGERQFAKREFETIQQSLPNTPLADRARDGILNLEGAGSE